MSPEDRKEFMDILDLYFKPYREEQQLHHRTIFGTPDKPGGMYIAVHDMKKLVKALCWIFSAVTLPVLGGLGFGLWNFFAAHVRPLPPP